VTKLLPIIVRLQIPALDTVKTKNGLYQKLCGKKREAVENGGGKGKRKGPRVHKAKASFELRIPNAV